MNTLEVSPRMWYCISGQLRGIFTHVRALENSHMHKQFILRCRDRGGRGTLFNGIKFPCAPERVNRTINICQISSDIVHPLLLPPLFMCQMSHVEHFHIGIGQILHHSTPIIYLSLTLKCASTRATEISFVTHILPLQFCSSSISQ
jgi:hypothetical protein